MLNIKEFEPQYITDESGVKTAVIIPISKFNELMEEVEDLAAVAERREEPAISHEEFVKELKKDGLVLDRVESLCSLRT